MPAQPDKDKTESVHPPALDKVGLLVAGIVHNLFGPMTALMGSIELMKMKHPEMEKETDRLSRLAHRLTDDIRVIMAKVTSDTKKSDSEFSLSDLMQEELDFFKADPRLKHMTSVQFDHSADSPKFWAMKSDFAMVIDALLLNAIEAMDDGDSKELLINVINEPDLITITIRDTGCGMDEETLARAFDPFYSTKTAVAVGKNPAIRATGLGLTLARELLISNNCKISLSSEVNEGTTVSISIPFREIDAQHRP